MIVLKKYFLLASIVSTGCASTFTVNRYAPYTDNIMELRKHKNISIAVGDFSETPKKMSENEKILLGDKKRETKELDCRGGAPIKTPDNESFSQYIKKAIVDELKISDLYSLNSPVVITGELQKIDFSSMSGYWELILLVKLSNGSQSLFKDKFTFTPSFFGETACAQAAQAFMPAVQNLIGKIIQSAEFKELSKTPINSTKK